MALNLPSSLIAEKNKLHTDSAWIPLLQIVIDGQTFRLAHNTEDVVWNGYTWQKFPFMLDVLTDDGRGRLPRMVIRVSNVSMVLMPHVEATNGGAGAVLDLYVVNSANLSETLPAMHLMFECESTSATAEWITFTLGAPNPLMLSFPPYRFMKDYCRYKVFGGERCKYAKTSGETCDRRFSTCVNTYNNNLNFGGFPSLGFGGIYA